MVVFISKYPYLCFHVLELRRRSVKILSHNRNLENFIERDNNKCSYACVVVYSFCLYKWSIYQHKAWSYCVLLFDGHSRASVVIIPNSLHASFFVNADRRRQGGINT